MDQDRIPFWTFCRHRHLWYYAWFSLLYYMWFFFLFLTKIQYTFSVLTSVSYSLKRMMYNSVEECLPSIHKGLGLIPNATRMKSKTIEFLGIFHLTIQWLWIHRVCPCCWNHTGGEAMDPGLREIWVWNALVGFFPLVCLSQKLKVQ